MSRPRRVAGAGGLTDRAFVIDGNGGDTDADLTGAWPG